MKARNYYQAGLVGVLVAASILPASSQGLFKNWARQTREVPTLRAAPPRIARVETRVLRSLPVSSWQPAAVDTRQLFRPLVTNADLQTRFPPEVTTLIKQTEEVSRNFDTFLWYHSKEERRRLAPVEINNWLIQVNQLSQAIKHAGIGQQYPAVMRPLLNRLQEIRYFFAMRSTSVVTWKANPARVLRADEFFLKTPAALVPGATWGSSSFFMPAKRGRPYQVPERLSVAVVNDNAEIRDALSVLKQAEFFPTWQFTFYASADGFIDALQTGAQRFDLVLTDLTFEEGSSGYEVVAAVRKQRLAVPVLLTTLYAAKESRAERLYAAGFDGMCSWGGVAKPLEAVRTLAQGIENYFYYARLHGWSVPAEQASRAE